MQSETSHQFNDQLAQWVARQGFWFQLRYSMAGGGATMLAYHILRLFLRALIFFLICGVIILFLLIKRPNQPQFKNTLRTNIVSALHAETGKLGKFSRTGDLAKLSHLALVGSKDSFFESLEAQQVAFKLGLLDGITQGWSLSNLIVDRLSISLKAGAETPGEATSISNAIIKKYTNTNLQNIEVKKAFIKWGYSSRTSGTIADSHLLINPVTDGWKLKFNGGTFQQNWLKDLNITELVLHCTDHEIIVEKGEFTCAKNKDTSASASTTIQGEIKKKVGTVSMHGVKITGGMRPSYSGQLELTNIPFDTILEEALASKIEGSMSGVLQIGGSTNSSDGVTLTGHMSLGEDDQIILRDNIPVLKSLSMLSNNGLFRKNIISEGYFDIATSSGALKVTNIHLTVQDILNTSDSKQLSDRVDLMNVTGNMIVKTPSPTEIDAMILAGNIDAELGMSIKESSAYTTLTKSNELTLKKAALASNKKEGEKNMLGDDGETENEKPFAAEISHRETQLKAAQKLASIVQFDGNITLNVHDSALPSNNNAIRDYFPHTSNNLQIIIDIPLKGNIEEITVAQAEEVLHETKKKSN